VILTNDKANDVRNKLVECSYTEKELIQLNELVSAIKVSVNYREQIITSLTKDNERLHRVLDIRQELIELGYQREAELQKVIRAEKRKKVVKWFYLGVGAVGGYFGYKGLR
jgi:predicted ribosome quality control (RQC) complex YloA/Tae2 family protein